MSYDKTFENIKKRFESLSTEHKKQIVIKIREMIKDYLELEDQTQKEQTCSNVGHDYTRWKHNSITSYKEDIFIPHLMHTIITDEWTRKCKRCGLFEETEDKPYTRKKKL